jgi:hypothetical protein
MAIKLDSGAEIYASFDPAHGEGTNSLSIELVIITMEAKMK